MTRLTSIPRAAAALAALALSACGGTIYVDGSGGAGAGGIEGRPASVPPPAEVDYDQLLADSSAPRTAEYAGGRPREAERIAEAADPAPPAAILDDAAFAARMAVSLPSWGSSDPEALLADRKFAVQPALSVVNAHYAYARGLSGRGVRLAVEDDGVDANAWAFSGRVADDGHEQHYWRPLAYDAAQNAFAACESAEAGCRVYEVAAGDGARIESLAREIVRRDGYPTRDDTWFIHNTDRRTFSAWYEIPALWEKDAAGNFVRRHGTQAASAALGWIAGVAPGANLVPLTFNFDERWELDVVGGLYIGFIDGSIAAPPTWDTAAFDAAAAAEGRAHYRRFDVVSRSYGVGGFSIDGLEAQSRSHAQDEQWLRDNLPLYWRMLTQTDVPAEERTLEVHAAGNDGLPSPGPDAATAYRVPEVRGISFAAAALDESGGIAWFSNRCGPLPDDWSAARDGRHYCLAVPGSSILVANPDPDPGTAEADDQGFASGTSFAAPIAAGGLAILIEAFRGQLTPEEIGKRLVNTADDSGPYADSLTYGAGVMDLDAATRPIGPLVTGAPALRAPLAATRLAAPAAWGDLGARLAGVEFAAFDAGNAPFWLPAGTLFSAPAPRAGIPVFPEDDAVERARLLPHLAWAAAPGAAFAPRAAVGAAPGAWAAERDAAAGAFGFSARPFDGPVRLGFLAETGANQGARPSGAFGRDARSRLAWVSREARWPVGGGLAVAADALVAAGRSDYPAGAMFQAGGAVYSSGALALERTAGESRLRLALSQPLRAESGRGTFTYPVGRTPAGAALYDTRDVALSPDGRETRLTLGGGGALGLGRAVWEVGYARDAGHVPGRALAWAGAAWRMRW